MIETISLLPGITLRCCRDQRFKQAALSLQLVRPMDSGEAAKNALLPSVLLRGSRHHPDLRSITLRLDDLYGASVSTLVRRIGDYQTTGLYCALLEDRFALEGDAILAPMVDFLAELLFDPVLEGETFCDEYVESEKKNLISTIESERNDKRAYAAGKLLKAMCKADSFGIPRLGEPEQVAAITPAALYAHYRKILSESPVEIFYVGSADPEQVARLIKPMFDGMDRYYVNLKPQTPFHDVGGEHLREEMEIAQGKLCMGFVTPITNQSPRFAAMQVANAVFGAGMTSKLFMNIREKLSLCYAIGSGYYGSKGIVTVSAGIDTCREEEARAQILKQLDACARGDITAEELSAAREAMLYSLRTVHDSPGAIEGYYGTAALSGLRISPAEYMSAIEAVTPEQVADAAATIRLHSSFFLKGVNP
ncbi:MAG: EF-P 5-aminopentanol modification-associated protein YfmF [Faecousia sp.]